MAVSNLQEASRRPLPGSSVRTKPREASIWGVDHGAKKIHLAALHPDNSLEILVFLAKPKEQRHEFLHRAHEGMYEVLSGEVWIEAPLMHHGNVQTALRMAETVGVVMSAAAKATTVDFLQPASWKALTVGNGHADKSHVQRWLQAAYPMYAALCDTQDDYDAVCIAIAGAISRQRMALSPRRAPLGTRRLPRA